MRKTEKFYHKHENEIYKIQFRQAKQAKCNSVTAVECTYYRSKVENCRDDSSNLYGLLNGLVGKSNGENPLLTRSNELQLANECIRYFLMKVKGQKASLFPIFQISLSRILLKLTRKIFFALYAQ